LDVDTKTLPRIGKLHRDGKIWKIRIDACFQREGVVTDEDKFNYFIAAAEDDIVILLREKKIQLKRSLTVDECVEVIKTKYCRTKSERL